MPEAAVAPLERAQKLAGAAAAAAVVAAILISIAALGGSVLAPVAREMRDTVITPDLEGAVALLNVILVNVLAVAPSLLLAGALLDLQKIMQEYEQGRFFTAKASTGVRKLGEALLWALAAKVAIVPTLLFYITGEGRMGLQFEIFDMGLAVISVFILLMGRVLEAATALKAENEQII